jgi:hypothetical protein
MEPTPAAKAQAALSAVAPCNNEEDGLPELHERLSNACRDIVGND